RQTGMATLSGQKANGDGSTGFTISGYHSETDRSQINRATIGNGTVVVREGSSQSVSGLNRDIALAQQLLKDEESNTNLYVSDSSLRSAFNPGETLERWKNDALNYHKNTLEVLNNLRRSGNMGGDALAALGNILEGKNIQEAIDGAWTKMAARTASWQITKYGSKELKDLAKILKDADNSTVAETEHALRVMANMIADLSGLDVELVVKAILADNPNVSFKSATDGKTIFVNFASTEKNAEGKIVGGTSISQSGDMANSIGHEIGHIANIEDEEIVDSIGNTLEGAWQSDLDWYGYGADTYDSEKDRNWALAENNNSVLENNNKSYYGLSPADLSYRHLHVREKQILKDLAVDYSKRRGVSQETAELILLNQAQRLVSLEKYNQLEPDQDAIAYLKSVSMRHRMTEVFLKDGNGQLILDPQGNKTLLFAPTSTAQYKDDSVFAPEGYRPKYGDAVSYELPVAETLYDYTSGAIKGTPGVAKEALEGLAYLITNPVDSIAGIPDAVAGMPESSRKYYTGMQEASAIGDWEKVGETEGSALVLEGVLAATPVAYIKLINLAKSPVDTSVDLKLSPNVGAMRVEELPDRNNVLDEVVALQRFQSNAEESLILNQRISLKGAVADEYLRLSYGLSNRRIRNEIGPALAGVLDTKTGKYYIKTNSGPGELPNNLVPLLESRIEGTQSISYLKTHGAGTHAEIHALNEALLARPDADLSDFLLYTINSGQRGSPVKWGAPIPRCPDCEFITNGVQYFPEPLKYGK
ncbi:MAG: YwqJ-related putative deaminase, partial [Pseudomonadota bacterium]|nr:YwqJ-related putative deaminase [Pseudomonadota bacterium]